MFADWLITNRHSRFQDFTRLMLALAVALVLLFSVIPASAQGQSQAPAQSQDGTQSNPQNNGKPKQDAPPEAGGPTDNVGPYAIPKKNPDEAPPPPPPPAAPKGEGMPDYSIKVNVPLVNVDVMVTTKSGQFVPGEIKDSGSENTLC